MKKIITSTNQCSKEILVEQILWLIRLRWLAIIGVLVATLVAQHVFPVLISSTPLFVCASVLFLCNVIFWGITGDQVKNTGRKNVVLGLIQIETDLVILTAVLHFSGGVANPFFLFYIFHIIIATIILPEHLSSIVGLTTIGMFGLLAVTKLNDWAWLGYYPLRFSVGAGIWRNPVYVFGAFIAFVVTVLLAQYLTRMILARMMDKELEAMRNNDVLHAVISAMAEGLLYLTNEGDIAICNPAAKLWKKPSQVSAELDSIEDFPEVLSEHMKALLGNGPQNGPVGKGIAFGHADGTERQFETKSCPVIGIDGHKIGHVIVGQDLTEHKKLEKKLMDQSEKVAAINEMLKMSRVQMAQREKMVAIGQMAAGIAHEIGNPLASLSSVVQYLARKLSSHEEKEHLLVIEYQVNRISNILKRMLTLSRPATAEYKWTDMNEVIANTLSLVKYDKRMSSVKIDDVSQSDLPMVWLNPQAIEQVLLNLFLNALDAMEARKDQEEHTLKITRSFIEGMIEIRIRDTGVGMSPEVCKRAFQSFFTTKEIGKGTGLGLFISYNLVAEIDGTIEMESEIGKGTTVIVRIPIRPKKDLLDGSQKPTAIHHAEASSETENL